MNSIAIKMHFYLDLSTHKKFDLDRLITLKDGGFVILYFSAHFFSYLKKKKKNRERFLSTTKITTKMASLTCSLRTKSKQGGQLARSKEPTKLFFKDFG